MFIFASIAACRAAPPATGVARASSETKHGRGTLKTENASMNVCLSISLSCEAWHLQFDCQYKVYISDIVLFCAIATIIVMVVIMLIVVMVACVVRGFMNRVLMIIVIPVLIVGQIVTLHRSHSFTLILPSMIGCICNCEHRHHDCFKKNSWSLIMSVSTTQ